MGMTALGQAQATAYGEEEGEGRILDTVIQDSFTIHLWEDRTRGELWVPSYDRTALALLNDDYLRIAGNNAVDTGRRTFEFRAMSEGRHRLVFEKRMGWKFTAEDRRVFVIRVAGRL